MKCSMCVCETVLCFLFLTSTYTTNAAPSASSEPCDETDPVCLKNIIQKSLPNFVIGMPEKGVEVLDPFHIDKLDLVLAGGLKIHFKDGHAKGLRKCVVEYARLYKDTLETRYVCNLVIKGKYQSSGRLLMFPINGDGDATIKCKNIRINSILKLKSKTGPSGTFLEVVSSTTNHSYDGRVQYNLTNLLKGSPVMSKMVLDFLNQNWQMVAQEFGDPIVEFGMDVILRNIKRLFSVVPMKQMFTTWEPNP